MYIYIYIYTVCEVNYFCGVCSSAVIWLGDPLSLLPSVFTSSVRDRRSDCNPIPLVIVGFSMPCNSYAERHMFLAHLSLGESYSALAWLGRILAGLLLAVSALHLCSLSASA